LFLSYKIKTSHRKIPWLVGDCSTEKRLFDLFAGEKTRLFALNKNATGMGTPVADKLNQKDWLNCYAETRPWGYREQAPILI